MEPVCRLILQRSKHRRCFIFLQKYFFEEKYVSNFLNDTGICIFISDYLQELTEAGLHFPHDVCVGTYPQV